MWEPRRHTTLWTSTACYRDSFTFFNWHKLGELQVWSWARPGDTQKTVCDSERQLIEPGYVLESPSGRWYVVLQASSMIQRITLDKCRNVGKPCTATKCARGNGFRNNAAKASRCVQRYSYSHLVTWDPDKPELCPRIRVFRFPTACVCYLIHSWVFPLTNIRRRKVKDRIELRRKYDALWILKKLWHIYWSARVLTASNWCFILKSDIFHRRCIFWCFANRFRYPANGFSFLLNFQIYPGVHRASSILDTGSIFTGGKAAVAWNCPLKSVSCQSSWCGAFLSAGTILPLTLWIVFITSITERTKERKIINPWAPLWLFPGRRAKNYLQTYFYGL
jgi:hypothetical protein